MSCRICVKEQIIVLFPCYTAVDMEGWLWSSSRQKVTSSIFLPLYQSGHIGLRGVYFPIGTPSFRLRYSYPSGQFDHLDNRNRLMNFRYPSSMRGESFIWWTRYTYPSAHFGHLQYP